MVELDYDQVLEELTNLTKKPDSDAFPEVLDRYLEVVAKNGDVVFPWIKVKPFMRRKLELVMDSFHRENPLTESQMLVPNCKPFDYQDLKGEIMKSFDWFYAAPFTIQRLCELLIEPGKHYRRTDKLMRGIEKNVIVVSTVQPRLNKYSTPESMEKQSNFKDFYPHFNSSPSHNNHLSSTSSASSSTSPNSAAILNGSLDSANSAQAHNSYDSSPSTYMNSTGHPLANAFYDQASIPPQLNNHHHMMEGMSDSPHSHSPLHHHSHANHHSPHSQHHHPQHSPLAPLQQLDSFTNVFATTTTPTHHHLTHLSANYSVTETSAHLTNGSAGTGTWPHDATLKGATTTNPYDSLLHPAHNDQLNDDNENIVVDDDDEDDKEDEERRASFGATEKEGDNSNDKDEVSGNKAEENSEAPQEPNSSSDEVINGQLVRSSQDLTPKKRPSPTPPAELPTVEQSSPEEESVPTEEAEPPLTPKKLRVQTDKSPESSESEPAPASRNLADLETFVMKMQPSTSAQAQDEEVSSESVVASSSASEENSPSVSLSLPSDDTTTPMDLNIDDSQQQQESIVVDSISSNSSDALPKSDDIAMSCPVTEESDSPDGDQVMDEPMDAE